VPSILAGAAVGGGFSVADERDHRRYLRTGRTGGSHSQACLPHPGGGPPPPGVRRRTDGRL